MEIGTCWNWPAGSLAIFSNDLSPIYGYFKPLGRAGRGGRGGAALLNNLNTTLSHS